MKQLVGDIAWDCSGDVRDNYSGRMMFGETCWAIVCDNVTSCVEAAAMLGLTGAKTDSMGLRYVVYWPHPQFTDECQEFYGIPERVTLTRAFHVC